MKMNNEEYANYVSAKMPRSPFWTDLLKAFVIGGLICCVGQVFLDLYAYLGLDEETAGTAECISMVFLGVLLTGIGIYDDIARHGGAGTLVPITGFANAVSSPALEFKFEGYILGTASKMFTIAGPVIVYGIGASVVYGIILWIMKMI